MCGRSWWSLPGLVYIVLLRANCWVKVIRSLNGTRENLLQVNVQKYQSKLLGSRTEANIINLHIHGVNSEQLKSFKLFGVRLDSELNFSEHISSVCIKASHQIGVLRRLKKLIPTHAKLQLYKAAILPHLTCNTIWHFCRAWDKRNVERVQERALRVVFNNNSVSHDKLLKLDYE